MVTTIVSIALM